MSEGEPLLLAHASLQTIISLWQRSCAARIIGDDASAEALRQEAHDVLDAYFDHADAQAQTVRNRTAGG